MSTVLRHIREQAARFMWMVVLLSTACTADLPLESLREDSPTIVTIVSVAAGDSEFQSTALPAPAGTTMLPSPGAAATAATEAPPPRVTPVPTTAPTLTLAPTETPTVAPSPTAKPSPTTEPSRYCPETPPLKPEYDRFYLSAKKWPLPNEAITEPHFWMSSPMPGANRILANQRFPYGWDENGRLLLHNGIDMAEDLGTPLLAVADGTVIVAQSDYSAWYGWRCDWYGHLVVIELDERWQDQPVYALYGHILNLMVEPGDRVERGQPVAEVGFGGAATNPHLHFEVRVGENEFENTRNPTLWIDPGSTRGVIAGRLVDPDGGPWQGVPLALLSEDKSTVAASTWSYLGDPQNLMNPDEGWAENFVFSDIVPGNYVATTQIQGVTYETAVSVGAGTVSTVEIVTVPYRTPTPEPSLEAAPSPTVAS